MQNSKNALRGRIIEIYGTIGNFAKEMNWSARKASYIASGRQILTATEAEECAEVLNVDNFDDFMRIFYPHLYIKWTA